MPFLIKIRSSIGVNTLNGVDFHGSHNMVNRMFSHNSVHLFPPFLSTTRKAATPRGQFFLEMTLSVAYVLGGRSSFL
jgi:hypothetical protein